MLYNVRKANFTTLTVVLQNNIVIMDKSTYLDKLHQIYCHVRLIAIPVIIIRCHLVSNGGGDGEDDHHKCDRSVARNC